MRVRSVLLAATAWAIPSLAAQVPNVPAGHPAMRGALGAIRSGNAWTLDQQVSMCEIPAPPFGEARRGAELAGRFKALGLVNVRICGSG